MPASPAKEAISFGPFTLVASERRLTRGGASIELSARAFDILVILLSRPNEIITKTELLAQAWAGINVDEGSLRFHIASLRKTLGDGIDGARYILTLPGQGYCFVAPVSRSSIPSRPASEAAPVFRPAGMSARRQWIIRRRDSGISGNSAVC
jgi:DNA-binding winged helix-turn-helix (wHTH) protein